MNFAAEHCFGCASALCEWTCMYEHGSFS